MSKTYLTWRAAMWWRVGFSNGASGDKLANPDQLDEEYKTDYEAGLKAGKESVCPA